MASCTCRSAGASPVRPAGRVRPLRSPASSTCRATATTRRTAGGSRRSSGGARRRQRRLRARACPSRCSPGCTTSSTSSPASAGRVRRRRDRGAASPRRRATGPTTSATRSSAQLGEERAGPLFDEVRRGVPRSRTRRTSRRARPCSTSNSIEQLEPDGDLGMSLYMPHASAHEHLAFKLLRSGRPIVALGRAAAAREHGRQGRRRAAVRDQAPRRPAASGSTTSACGTSEGADFQADDVRERFEDAFARVWRGDAENDGFNRLVLRAGLTGREVAVLARVREVPAPDRDAVQPDVHRGRARRRTP